MASMELRQLKCYDKYVARTKRCLPDKFAELCRKHLAVLLDMRGDKVELLPSGHKEHQKKKSGLSSLRMFKRKNKSQGLFGLPLTDEGVYLMMPLIEFLQMETNVTKEGLFRKPGNKSRMTSLRELLIAHGAEVNIDPEVFSAHDVASVLKEFLRELPKPLLTEQHLEAHMHILALGQHAETPEEIADYSSRKLSAVQLLMLLLPSPAHVLTMHLVRLLKKTADSPETRMTSATLGTLFAPIFFSERKGQPINLLEQIFKTTPAAIFLIDNAHELFQAPKELVTELTRFWKSGRMQKSLSGQTLYPDVSYADSNMSRCDESASNVTAELADMSVHRQAHKGKTKKSFDGTEFSASLRRCRRSIASAIRKSLPYLTCIRRRQGESPRSRSSSVPRPDNNTVTLADCSTEAPETRHPLQKPGHKHQYSSEDFPTSPSYSRSNHPVKQKCHEHSDCHKQLPPNGCSAKVVSDFVYNENHRYSNSSLDDIITRVIESLKTEGPHICNAVDSVTTPDWVFFHPNSKVVDLFYQRKLAPIQLGRGHLFDITRFTKVSDSIKSTTATDPQQQTSRKPQTEVIDPATNRLTRRSFHETAV